MAIICRTIQNYKGFSKSACEYFCRLYRGSEENASDEIAYKVCCQLLIDTKDGIDITDMDSMSRPIYSGWIREIGAEQGFKRIMSENPLWCDNLYYNFGTTGKCRRYAIPSKVTKEFLRIQAATDYEKRLNIFDMKPIDRHTPFPIKTESRYTESNHKRLDVSDLMVNAVKTLRYKPVKVNFLAFRDYITELEAKLVLNQLSKKEQAVLPMLRGFKCLVMGSYESKKQKKERINGDPFCYITPEYNFTYTGRIMEVWGLQNISREARVVLLEGIDYCNLDIEKSQLNALNYFLKKHGLDNGAVSTLLNVGFAELTNHYHKDQIKSCIYNTIFNAGFSLLLESVDEISRFAGKNNVPFAPVERLLKPLGGVAKELADVLLKSKEYRDSKGCLVNACGGKLTPAHLNELISVKVDETIRKAQACSGEKPINPKEFDDYDFYAEESADWHESFYPSGKELLEGTQRDRDSAERKIALAFFLQGLEAYIIHTVTIAGEKNDYTPISNQHDGLIVIGNHLNVQKVMQQINRALDYNFVLAEKSII